MVWFGLMIFIYFYLIFIKNHYTMRILKSHPLLKLVNSYLIDASQPSNISYLWNFGSLLLVCLVIQLVTGITLAMHYSPNVLEAFNSIEHIQNVLFKSGKLLENLITYIFMYKAISRNTSNNFLVYLQRLNAWLY